MHAGEIGSWAARDTLVLFLSAQRSLWPQVLWVSEAAFFLQRLCYKGGERLWPKLAGEGPSPGIRGLRCCPGQGGKGWALGLCSSCGCQFSFLWSHTRNLLIQACTKEKDFTLNSYTIVCLTNLIRRFWSVSIVKPVFGKKAINVLFFLPRLFIEYVKCCSPVTMLVGFFQE